MTLTPDQFAALIAYIDTAIVAERHLGDNDGGLIEWIQKGEAHKALENALVAVPVEGESTDSDTAARSLWQAKLRAAAGASDQRCACTCADQCALGRAGMADRCAVVELLEHGHAKGWVW